MNYIKLSATCLDPVHHIHTVHYLSLKPPRIKFTSNISSWWCHCWFLFWFIKAWIITSVKQCTLQCSLYPTSFVFERREKKGKCPFYILSTWNQECKMFPKCGIQCDKDSKNEWFRYLFWEHWAWWGNTLRNRHPSIIGCHVHTNPHTHLHLKAFYTSQSTYWYDCGSKPKDGKKTGAVWRFFYYIH